MSDVQWITCFSCGTVVFSWRPWLVGWAVSCGGTVCGGSPVLVPCADPRQPCTPPAAAELAFLADKKEKETLM